MKRLAIIGSTGSIGTNTLDVVEKVNGFYPYALAVKKNITRLENQIKRYKPKTVCVWDKAAGGKLEKRRRRLGVKVLVGRDGLNELVRDKKVEVFAFGLSGSDSVYPLLEALKSGKRVTIANKEPLVLAGNLIRKYIKRYKSEIIPVDSEHSAIFQCLMAHKPEEVEKIILTSSGGPFFKMPKSKFKLITPKMALNHPKWKMGKKITVDSATMMNKALEIIEATTLFGVSHKKIEVLIHPGAIVHSMVQFVDGSVLAQLGLPDMRLPIQYALTYPRRLKNPFKRANFSELQNLQFFKPDLGKFPALKLGFWAAREGGTLPAVLNAADEILVPAFLDRKIGYLDILKNLEKIMKRHRVIKDPTYNQIMDADKWAREEAKKEF